MNKMNEFSNLFANLEVEAGHEEDEGDDANGKGAEEDQVEDSRIDGDASRSSTAVVVIVVILQRAEGLEFLFTVVVYCNYRV